MNSRDINCKRCSKKKYCKQCRYIEFKCLATHIKMILQTTDLFQHNKEFKYRTYSTQIEEESSSLFQTQNVSIITRPVLCSWLYGVFMYLSGKYLSYSLR